MSRADTQRPKKSLGQNFLTDPNVARKIVAALGIRPGDAVLEIGPGRGALTEHLMESGAGAVLAVEKDTSLAPQLKGRWPGLQVVNADALQVDWTRLDRLPGIRVVGNLPYNVASPLMWDIASLAGRFARAVFMVQLEVAERIVAAPRTKAYGGLSVWLQSFVEASKLFKVGPQVFYPQPKVDSAVVCFTPRPEAVRPGDPARLARFVKRLFSLRRKQLGRILGPELGHAARAYLDSQGLGPACRPEELSPTQMRRLMDEVEISGGAYNPAGAN